MHGQLAGTASQEGVRSKGQTHARGCSNLGQSLSTLLGQIHPGQSHFFHSISSTCLFQKTLLCKVWCFLSLEPGVHVMGSWLGFTLLLTAWNFHLQHLPVSFLDMHHTDPERLHKFTRMVRREDILYPMKLLMCLVNTEAAEVDLPDILSGKPVPISCRYTPWSPCP